MPTKTITLTYGDVCENHVGMEKIGTLSQNGLTPELLQQVHAKYPDDSQLFQLQQLPEQEVATVLVIRNGVNLLLDDRYPQLYAEQDSLEPDTKAFMKGRVVTKQARYNLCFSQQGHEPEFEQGKGTVIPFDKVPVTTQLKHALEGLFETDPLQCEGNYYYDTSLAKVGIGFHGDTERRIVIGARLGDDMPIAFWWFRQFTPRGDPVRITLHGGDIYAMCKKTTGFDWKKSTVWTLRHSAGSNEYINNEIKRINKLVERRKTKRQQHIDYDEEIPSGIDCAEEID